MHVNKFGYTDKLGILVVGSFSLSSIESRCMLPIEDGWDGGPRSWAFIKICDSEKMPMRTQEAIAMTWLSRNTAIIGGLSQQAGVEAMTLTLHLDIVLSDSVLQVVLATRFDLLKECVRCGVEPAVYVNLR